MHPVLTNIAAIIISCCIVCLPVIATDLRANTPAYANTAMYYQYQPYSDDKPVILPQVPEQTQPQETQADPPRAKIALTFDDGPHPIYTPLILDLLKQYNAKATFFLVGAQAAAYPDIVQRIFAENHELGSHTQWHLSASAVGYWPAYRDAELGFRTIANIIGMTTTVFRSPYGEWSGAYADACNTLRMQPVWWDVDSLDWQRRGSKTIVTRVLARLEPGMIVLFHDGGGDRSQTVAALAVLLEELKAKNWAPVTVSDLNKPQ